MNHPVLGAVALSLVLVGCDEPKSPEGAAEQALSTLDAGGEQSLQDKVEATLLAFVNAPDTTFDVLDLDVGLDKRAAERIVRHRDGRDGIWGTSDDDLIGSIDELLSIDYVGETAILSLEAWVAYLAQDGEVVEGVAFTDEEAILVVSLANAAEAEWLDDEIELDARAVDHIVDARPIADLRELAALPYVGPATLERLRDASHK
jgi:DNA uptake protein ComE-like DNA-binding protein